MVSRGFWDALATIGNQVILPAVTTQLQGIALLIAQLTAGIADGGIGAIVDLIGKRDVALDAAQMRGFWDALATIGNQVILPAVTTQLQGIALLVAQLTAGIADGGIGAIVDLIGKRDAAADAAMVSRGFWDALATIGNQVILPAVTTQLQGIALLVAQLTAGIADGGIGAIVDLIGKREVNLDAVQMRGFWDALATIGNQVILPAVTTQLQGIALLIAQLTAGIADGGIGAIVDLIG